MIGRLQDYQRILQIEQQQTGPSQSSFLSLSESNNSSDEELSQRDLQIAALMEQLKNQAQTLRDELALHTK